MSTKPFTVSRALARELKRIDERTTKQGAIPDSVIHQDWLDDMERDLRRMAAAYDGTPRKAKELFEALLIAEAEGVAGVAQLRRSLAGRLRKRKAA